MVDTVKWSKITSLESEEEYFDRSVRESLASPGIPLPLKLQRIGNAAVNWFETEPGIAAIFASGGNSPEDRALGIAVVKEQLEGHGYKQAQFTFEPANEFSKVSHWNDIMAKAKRLMDSGAVQITRNSPQTISSVVQGDHGVYNPELSREDPNSRALTQWSCGCPWSQFAFQRCVVAGTMITMADGAQRPVEDVMSGDAVIDHTGSVGVVEETHEENWEDDVITIGTSGFNSISVKPNHPVLGVESDQVSCKDKDQGSVEPKFRHADKFVVGDYLVRPTLGSNQLVKVTSVESVPYKGKLYDLTVMGNPGYLAEGFSVHNTRKWKKYEARPCSHVLATWWKAQGTPVDEDIHPEVTQGPAPPMPPQGPVSPVSPGEQARPMAPPVPPVASPPEPTGPDVLPQFPGDPSQQPEPQVSVPGTTGPTPENPVASPFGTGSPNGYGGGVLSSLGWDFEKTSEAEDSDDNYMYHLAPTSERDRIRSHGLHPTDPNDSEHWGQGHLPRQKKGVYAFMTPEQANEYRGAYPNKSLDMWKIPRDQVGATWPDYASEGHVIMHPVDAELHTPYEDTQDKTSARENDPAVPQPEGFQNGNMVQLKASDYGIAEGKSEAHGSGQYREVPANSIGEVQGQDPTTGMIEAIYPLHDAGPMEPYHVRMYHFPSEVTLRPDLRRPGPFRRRRL